MSFWSKLFGLGLAKKCEGAAETAAAVSEGERRVAEGLRETRASAVQAIRSTRRDMEQTISATQQTRKVTSGIQAANEALELRRRRMG